MRLLMDLRDAARRQAETEVKIDFFATSLPSMLLFEDDLARRNRANSRYLEGLADLGLGSPAQARTAFDEVLTLDPYHGAARWALAAAASPAEAETLTIHRADD